MSKQLTPAQWKTLARLCDHCGLPSGTQPGTIGALYAAGYLRLDKQVEDVRFRPTRCWSGVRWSKRRETVQIDVTQAGRDALAAYRGAK